MTTDCSNLRTADRRRSLTCAAGENGIPMRRISDLDDAAFDRFIEQLLTDAALQQALLRSASPARV